MAQNELSFERATHLANEISVDNDADLIVFSGTIDSDSSDKLIRIVKENKEKDNVILVLTTRGGSPDAAYRIARCLQKYYNKLVLYVYGRCKSAGTLVCLAADELILSDYGEIGPLDIQLDKKDELFENTSGLNITQALSSLNERTLYFFRDVLINLRSGSKSQISTKLASQIATNISIGVYAKIYEQIDPSQLGSIERAISIAHDYGERLKSENVKEDTLTKLVTKYSSHSFVIDNKEAEDLFNTVRRPTEKEEQFGECIYFLVRDETKTSFIYKFDLNEDKEESDDQESEIRE